MCCQALSREEDTKTKVGLAALGNVLSGLRGGIEDETLPYQDSKVTRLLKGWLSDDLVFCVFVPARADEASVALLRVATRLKRTKENVPNMIESLKTKQLREAHEAELESLKLQQRDAQLSSDAALAKAIRDGDLAAKEAADEFERRDREVAAALKAEDLRAQEQKQEAYEADRKLAADLLAAEVK